MVRTLEGRDIKLKKGGKDEKESNVKPSMEDKDEGE
jgi:hypothetical protein